MLFSGGIRPWVGGDRKGRVHWGEEFLYVGGEGLSRFLTGRGTPPYPIRENPGYPPSERMLPLLIRCLWKTLSYPDMQRHFTFKHKPSILIKMP